MSGPEAPMRTRFVGDRWAGRVVIQWLDGCVNPCPSISLTITENAAWLGAPRTISMAATVSF